MLPFSDHPAELAAACRARFFGLVPPFATVVTDDPVHIGYLCGYRTILHDMMPYPQVAIVSAERIALVTGASDGAAALEVLGDAGAIWRYGTFFVGGAGQGPDYRHMPPASATVEEAFAAALAALAPSGPVGCDLLRPQLLAVAEAQIGAGRLVPAADAFRLSRAVKLPREQAALRYVSALTDRALDGVVGDLRPGISELEIAAEINRVIVAGGGIPRFTVVTSGERSSRVDAYAGARRLQPGDLVRIDIGATVHGYCSDMARSYVIGEAEPLAAERYAALLRGEEAGIARIRAGVPAGEVFEAAVAEVRAGALPDYNRNHCGHGIGLRANEFPALGPASETPLEAGMVLCVETPYYEIGWGGMMVEDTVIVTEQGCEVLTHTSRLLNAAAQPALS